MLSLSIVQEIDRLLREGKLSHRKIARQLGVSRGTVGAIASGRRGLFGKDSSSEVDDPLRHEGPPVRCQVCGFLVYVPCLVCEARAFRDRQKHGHPPISATQSVSQVLRDSAPFSQPRVA